MSVIEQPAPGQRFFSMPYAIISSTRSVACCRAIRPEPAGRPDRYPHPKQNGPTRCCALWNPPPPMRVSRSGRAVWGSKGGLRRGASAQGFWPRGLRHKDFGLKGADRKSLRRDGRASRRSALRRAGAGAEQCVGSRAGGAITRRCSRLPVIENLPPYLPP